jgi:hypothetical protein
VAVSYKIDGLANEASPLSQSSRSNTITRLGKSSFDANTANTEDTVSLTKRNQLSKKNLAYSQISGASSFVSTATNAISGIEELLKNGIKITEKLNSATFSEQRLQLEEEAANILTQIDEVISKATFNDQSVINAGIKSFSLNLDSKTGSSTNSHLIQISNIAISKQDIGISSLTESDFLSDPNQTEITLEQAYVLLQQQKSTLNAVDAELEHITEKAATLFYQSDEQLPNDASATTLANDLAEAIRSSLPLQIQNLDSSFVNDLISNTEQITTTEKD